MSRSSGAARTATRNEETYARLRADILAGRLRPGQKLGFSMLQSTYGVSVSVIREALSRLDEQGLVENLPQRGFLVTRISPGDLEDLTDARCEIETLVLRRAIAEGDVRWESMVIAAHHRLTRTPLAAEDDPRRLSEEWVQVHAEFHSTLLAACRNPRLTSIADHLRASGELYRRWSVPLAQSDRNIEGEHDAIVRAVLARDPDEATALLTSHIRRTTELLLESGFAVDGTELSDH